MTLLGRLSPVVFSFSLAVAASAQSPVQTAPLDRANLDSSCAACDDFYEFANGGWLSRAKIPAAYPEFGAFQELYDRNEATLHDILETSARNVKSGQYKPGTGEWKVGAYYATCMDTLAIEQRGAAPLKQDLDLIASINTREDLKRSLGELEKLDGLAPWGDGSAQDARDAANTIAGLYQGGLTLPNNEYYTKTDSASVSVRRKFVDHVTRMFQLLGDPATTAASEAQTVLAMETRFAKASRTPVQLRDVVNNYHRMTLAQLDSLTPNFSWNAFYASVGAPPVEKIDVGQPEFFVAVDSMVTTVPVSDWKTYLRWQLVHRAAPGLSTPFVKENFEFSKAFTGATEMLPRWKRCVSATDANLGELLGQQYVARAFTPAAKARAVAIVDNLVTELRGRVEQLPWMGPETKQQALVKLDAMTRKIGYPDKWRDYSKLQIGDTDYFANRRASQQWAAARDFNKIGKPTDRSEW